MHNKNHMKSRKKKHSLFWLYREQLIQIVYIMGQIASIILCLCITLIGIHIMKEYSDITRTISILLADSLLVVGFLSLIRPISGKAYVTYKRLRNMRYLPISHDECITLGIRDANEYIITINDMLYVDYNYTSKLCPLKIQQEIGLFAQEAFGQKVRYEYSQFIISEEVDSYVV